VKKYLNSNKRKSLLDVIKTLLNVQLTLPRSGYPHLCSFTCLKCIGNRRLMNTSHFRTQNYKISLILFSFWGKFYQNYFDGENSVLTHFWTSENSLAMKKYSKSSVIIAFLCRIYLWVSFSLLSIKLVLLLMFIRVDFPTFPVRRKSPKFRLNFTFPPETARRRQTKYQWKHSLNKAVTCINDSIINQKKTCFKCYEIEDIN